MDTYIFIPFTIYIYIFAILEYLSNSYVIINVILIRIQLIFTSIGKFTNTHNITLAGNHIYIHTYTYTIR